MKKLISVLIALFIFSSGLCVIPIEAAQASVSVDNVKTMPEKVKVSSFADFKKKLATAVNLKKGSLVIEISKYNKKNYPQTDIKKYFDSINYDLCFSKGYSVFSSYKWISSDTKAVYSFKFTYKNIKSTFGSSIKKAKTSDELNKIIENAVLQKLTEVSVALANYSSWSYNLENSVSLANKTLKKRYKAVYDGSSYLSVGGNKLLKIYISYKASTSNEAVAKTISSYDEFYAELSDVVSNMNYKFVFELEDYDVQKYNLGQVLLKLNKDILSKDGYCARVSYKMIKDESPVIMEVYLEYVESYDSDFVASKDKGKPIFKNEAEWYKAIRKTLTDCSQTLEFNATYSLDRGNIISLVLEQNPDISYINGYKTRSDGTILFNYNYTESDLTKIVNQTKDKAKEIIADIIKPDMTETQKARAIHNYLIQNARYDIENFKSDTLPDEAFTAYGILIKGTGVCQGYAAAFKLLANMVGIKCIGVGGTAGEDGIPHEWNMAKLDGNVVYIDVTWDDPIPDRGSHYRSDYFAISKNQMSLDHTWNESDYVEKYLEY